MEVSQFNLAIGAANGEMNNTVLNYTTINHEARKSLGLSVNEYCVIDLIHNLANNPKNTQQGWCYASKEKLAEYLDIGRATAYRALKVALEAGLLEKHPEQKNLIRTTHKWYDTVIMKVKEEGEGYANFEAKNTTPSQNETTRLKMRQTPSQNETFVEADHRLKMIRNKDIYKDKDNYHQGKPDIVKISERLISQIPVSGGATYEWQDYAVRMWKAIGLSDPPSKSWFKLFRECFKNNRRWVIDAAYSLIADLDPPPVNPEAYFYKLVHQKLNEVSLPRVQINIEEQTKYFGRGGEVG